MSIYATQWILQFPRYGNYHTGCEWVEVIAQGVPAHIGTPTPGHGYEAGDPYADFLPPAIEVPPEEDYRFLRAVVFVTKGTPKGTPRAGQEYVCPLLVMTGQEYAVIPFDALYQRICDALRGDRPRCGIEVLQPDGRHLLLFEDGSSHEIQLAEKKGRRNQQ